MLCDFNVQRTNFRSIGILICRYSVDVHRTRSCFICQCQPQIQLRSKVMLVLFKVNILFYQLSKFYVLLNSLFTSKPKAQFPAMSLSVFLQFFLKYFEFRGITYVYQVYFNKFYYSSWSMGDLMLFITCVIQKYTKHIQLFESKGKS